MSAQIMVSQSALLHHQRLSQSPSPPPMSSSSSIRRAHSTGSGGILLNSSHIHRPHPLRQSSSANTSPTTSSHPSTSSAPPRKSASAGSGPYSRSIRFAPLPDPRRAVAMTETGDVVPIIDSPCALQGIDDDCVDPKRPASPLPPLAPNARASTPTPNDGSGTGTDTGDVASIGSSTIREQDSKKRKWTKKLLGPLLTSGRSSSLSPRGAGFDPESPKPGGSGLGMWRSSSKDSTSSTGLWRTASRESTSSIGSNAVGDGPTGRRQSTGSASDRASIAPKNPTLPKGRMLNGRVYGVGGGAARNFQTTSNKQYEEPAFVEWGYGGMGSNNATPTAPAADYKKLAGSSTVDDDDGSGMGWVRRRREARERAAKEAEEKAKSEAAARSSETSASETEECNDSSPVGSSTSSTTDVTSSESATPDDSRVAIVDESGQTIELPEITIHLHTPTTPERPLKNAQKPAEGEVPAQDDTPEAKTTEPSSPPPQTTPTKPQSRPPPIHIPDDADAPTTNGGLSTPTKQRPGLVSAPGDETPMMSSAIHVPTLGQQQEPERTSEDTEKDPEHVYTAVTIPVKHRHHHHHHRSASMDIKTDAIPIPIPGDGVKTPTEVNRASMELGLEPVSGSPTSSSSSRSSTSGDEEDERERDEEDESESEDEEEDEETEADIQRLKTTLGAGVEKVSKHKE